ncbi:MAG: energy transducer TonB [Treponemataceae bacterium]|nr:energy transducer TonB [Treponemataceae bacterium]
MKKFDTENKSIIISIIFTLIIYIIVFCIFKIDLNNTTKNNYQKMINKNIIKIQISSNKEESKTTDDNKNHIQKENLKTNENYFITETKENNIKTQTDIKHSKSNENINTNLTPEKNIEENFYPIEMAKQITEDIIDKKIIQHLVYPEKAIRRGIEGEIIIKVKISKNGNLLDYEIISKNNNQILEESSITTINKIFPIKELNTKNTLEDFSTIITFVYKLN